MTVELEDFLAGMGLSFTPLAHGVLASVPESSAGEASGMSNATREMGGVFGIAEFRTASVRPLRGTFVGEAEISLIS
ncbi:hypothetical protein J2T13_002356 [Paenibacillus sp. DS2015]|uniref:hypothetical protein n=1 Tax=Paenibacillus sp. DS2015 TaxID=3373917 RepID=UPI003D23C248